MGEMEENSASELATALRPLLRVQTRMLDRVLHRLSGGEGGAVVVVDPDVIAVTTMMIHAAGVSTHSILKLTQRRELSLRDCFGIARSISELAVNTCYIAAVGPEAARRARFHALQKSYRDLDRNGTVGGFGFTIRSSAKPQVDDVPELAAALAEFTRGNGREVTEWTPLSISDRIDTVRTQHSGVALSLAGSVTSVYRHSSEQLHGTYFGVVHFLSAGGAPAKSRERYNECWDEHFVAIFTAAYFGAQAIVEMFATLLDLPDIAVAQKQLTKALAERMVP